MYIGDIYLPILSKIDKKSVSKITKEIAGINAKEPRTVSIRRNLQPITLEGYLYNDGEKDDAQYAEDVEALQYRSAGYCYTKYADLDGFIEIENAEAPQTSEELGVRNYSVEGKYLPASKYERVVEVETEMRENEFNIEFPPHVALPVGATNVRVKTSQDSVKLSAPAFMAGDIPIYRPFPAFYPDDVTHSAGDTPKYDTTAYKMSYNLLDAKDESISYTFVSGVDVPLGSYRVVLRMKEDTTIASDARIVVLSGDNVIVDSLHTLVGDNVWNIVKSASFNITQRGITYTIMVSKAEADVANLAVNYGFLLPEKRARVAFDVAAEYDVGECKVFDTITTDSEESTWKQVFNPEHDFAGDIVVQNSMFRWVIKQTAWKDATKVYNISGSAPVEIGKLYNKAFGDDSVAIKFKEIKPNYLKFTFELDTGNATSESTSAKEIDTVEITPFNVVIDKDVIGAYKDHYTFKSTPDVMVEYENGIIAGFDSNSVYGLIKSVDVTSSYDGDIIETTGSESSDSYVVPFVIPCEITSYLYKQAADLVISKDNGDVERKFWKDDFSVDSSDNYTNYENCPFTISDGVLTLTGNSYSQILTVPYDMYEQTQSGTVKARLVISPKFNMVAAASYYGFCLYLDANRYSIFGIGITKTGMVQLYSYVRSGSIGTNKSVNTSATYTGSETYTIDFEFSRTNVKITNVDFGTPISFNTPIAPGAYTESVNFGIGVTSPGIAGTTISNITIAPSISYADDFATDTTERYQPVLGTVAYDDTNKRMNVTTAAGANGKASGRLKSYKFCEGSQIYDVLLPTGADGDFICLATHSANGLMTDGIGVGLQSDGTGNWNLVTLSGTTVTVGASSGLTDGKTARIEIEKDITGAYWYYIYDAAGTKPTTATGKLYTALSEGYTGWYANGNNKTYAIENISIRAESIVGRTNVEVTEPFWFRDEFGEDSLGRYRTTFTFSDGVVTAPTIPIPSSPGVFCHNWKIRDGNYSFEWTPIANGADGLCEGMVSLSTTPQYQNNITGSGYTFRYHNGFINCVRKDSGISTTLTKVVSGTPNIVLGTTYVVDVIHNSTGTENIKLFIYEKGTARPSTPTSSWTDTTYTDVYFGFGVYTNTYGGGLQASFDNLQISGTRVYNKPIHRGAMLETYHDGTQEVVGTTLIDDCQWDRTSEWTPNPGTVITHNAAEGCVSVSRSSSSTTVTLNNGLVFGDGIFEIDLNLVTPDAKYLFIYPYGRNKYRVVLFYPSSDATLLSLEYYNGSEWSRIGSYTYTFAYGTWYTIRFEKFGTTFNVYLNGVLVITCSDSHFPSATGSMLLDGFKGGSDACEYKFRNLVIIAAESSSTNSIATCIPPIGGGARYGVEESVYNTFTTENVNKGVYLTTAKVKTTNPNADEVSLEYTNDTTSITLNTTSIDVDATYTVKIAPIIIDANETDTLRVSVKNSTTCVQSTNYVDSLSLIPVSGDDVLYPQDLAFISGVKPSQKRKVEVK